jgi:hypothetical protein
LDGYVNGLIYWDMIPRTFSPAEEEEEDDERYG